MAQPGAVAVDGACNVQLMASVAVPAAAAGPLKQVALGLDDEHRFCMRIVELVQVACANSDRKAREFVQASSSNEGERANGTGPRRFAHVTRMLHASVAA